ncbi:class I SAM-dependent methyltransferase [Parablautia muri]|nr:class I SAM-dependent methyltransferase [Parablautia muri]
MNYRDKIYEGYDKDLQKRMSLSTVEKERKMISKYVKRNYLRYIPKDKNITILDLGCGMGHYLAVLQDMGYSNVKGVDISEGNVRFCKADGLDVVCQDAEEYLNTHKNQYDVIIFNDVIEHFKKEEVMPLLVLIKESLKDGGIVITKTDNEANPFCGISGRYMDFTHELGFVSLSLQQIYEAAEFKNVEVIGADIYVWGGVVSYLVKIISKIVYFVHYLLCCMAGRWSIRIFEKCIICKAEK